MATTVSSTINLREKSRFLPFNYSYSRPVREVRCFPNQLTCFLQVEDIYLIPLCMPRDCLPFLIFPFIPRDRIENLYWTRVRNINWLEENEYGMVWYVHVYKQPQIKFVGCLFELFFFQQWWGLHQVAIMLKWMVTTNNLVPTVRD